MVIFGGTSGSVRAPAAGLAATDIVSRETTNQPDSISAKVKLKRLPWCRLSVGQSSAKKTATDAISLIYILSKMAEQSEAKWREADLRVNNLFSGYYDAKLRFVPMSFAAF